MADWLDGGVPADLVINEGATASVDTSVYYSSPSSLKLVEGLYSNYWPTGCLITLPSQSTAISVSLRVRCDSATDLFVEAYWTGGYARHYSASTGTSGSWVLVSFTIPAHTPTDPIRVAVSAENAPDQAVLYIDSVTYSGQTGSWLDGGVVPANVEAFGPVSVDTTVFHSSPSSLKLLGEAGFVGSGFGGGFQLVIPQGSAPTPVSLRLRCDDDAEIGVYSSNALNDGEEFYTDTATSGWVSVSFTVDAPTSSDGYVEVVAYGYDAPATLYVDDWSAALVLPEQSGTATGFLTTSFGTPTRPNTALGFVATNFGTPVAEQGGDRVVTAYGFLATNFGTPAGNSWLRASALRPVAQFGTPMALGAPQSGEASGWRAPRFGTPHAWFLPETSYNLVTMATGWRTTRFGTPASPVDQAERAYGFKPIRFGTANMARPLTAFGTPRASLVQPANGFSQTQFGVPSAQTVFEGEGFRPVQFGTPSAEMINLATGFPARVRFGRPSASTPGAHTTYGFWAGARFGQPIAIQDARQAQGFLATRFGDEHEAFETHLAQHIPPSTRFGRPTASRTPLC